MLFTVQDYGRARLMMTMVEAFLIRIEIKEKVYHPCFRINIQEVVRKTRIGAKSLPSNIGWIEVKSI